MGPVELLILAVGLSMDAFSAALCKGMTVRNLSIRRSLLIGLFFGGFQAGMPLAGYLFGIQFRHYIVPIDHWVAFVLLTIIGLRMIHESRQPLDMQEDLFQLRDLTLLAIATSIDALAVGVAFAFLAVDIISAAAVIGLTTFALSFFAARAGCYLGGRYRSRAEFAGGVVLIGIGLKILLSHLGVVDF